LGSSEIVASSQRSLLCVIGLFWPARVPIGMTPMIDIVFQLLIFFILVTGRDQKRQRV
jgi:hypothetical protein